MTNENISDLTAFDNASLDQAFAALAKQAANEAKAINGSDDLEAFRLRWVGRKQAASTTSRPLAQGRSARGKESCRRTFQDS